MDMTKVKTILVSQPEPKIENSPYFDLQEKQKVKIDKFLETKEPPNDFHRPYFKQKVIDTVHLGGPLDVTLKKLGVKSWDEMNAIHSFIDKIPNISIENRQVLGDTSFQYSMRQQGLLTAVEEIVEKEESNSPLTSHENFLIPNMITSLMLLYSAYQQAKDRILAHIISLGLEPSDPANFTQQPRV